MTCAPASTSSRTCSWVTSRTIATSWASGVNRQEAALCGQDIHAALGPLAVASHQHPLHGQGATGEAGLQVLNAAYLVYSASVPQFAEAARAIAAEAGALRVAVTGPWPAYSFADVPGALPCRRSPPESLPAVHHIRTWQLSICLTAFWLAGS
ncbi:MAG TPA: GvpL/GvpF family gas vesicle protein [Streptosporangiaceae bacterium]|nr:GvpL/GvpF family gas vesicle protein [Streptosporangiaceae bacterium]